VQYKCIHSVGSTKVYNNYYSLKLYQIVKIGCKLTGDCKIVSVLKMCKGEAKTLSYKIKLLK